MYWVWAVVVIVMPQSEPSEAHCKAAGKPRATTTPRAQSRSKLSDNLHFRAGEESKTLLEWCSLYSAILPAWSPSWPVTVGTGVESSRVESRSSQVESSRGPVKSSLRPYRSPPAPLPPPFQTAPSIRMSMSAVSRS